MDINNPVFFDKELRKIISNYTSLSDHDHLCWGDEALLPVRRHIRKHYGPLQNYLCYYCRRELSMRSNNNNTTYCLQI